MRRILKASAQLGVGSVIVMGLSAVRYKLIAVEFGAAGVGLLGLLAATLTLAITLFGLGSQNSAVRYVSVTEADEAAAKGARSAVVRGTTMLGALSGLLVAGAAPLIGPYLFPGEEAVMLTAWLALALAASIMAGGHVALLTGLQRFADLVKVNVGGAVLGTAVTAAATWWSREWALAAALAAVPVFTWLAASWATRFVRPRRSGFREIVRVFRPIVRLGVIFSASLLLGQVVQVAVRLYLERRASLESVGYYQAAWTIANVYLGLVLGAMASEYFPRISRIADDVSQLNASVNAQVRLALTVGVPLTLGTMVAAPLMIALLYDASFGPSVELLRWQMLGDVFKLPAWALAFLLLAREERRHYFVAELLWGSAYLTLTLALFPIWGFRGLGLAYVGAYVTYLAAVVWASRRSSGLALSPDIVPFLLVSVASGGLCLWLVRFDVLGLLAAGLVVSLVTLFALVQFGWWTRLRVLALRRKELK